MRARSIDPREKRKQDVHKGATVHRATVECYRKLLDERGTLQKTPGKASKLDERAVRLLAGDLQLEPWTTRSQRTEFLLPSLG